MDYNIIVCKPAKIYKLNTSDRMFTVPYFSARLSRLNALQNGQPSVSNSPSLAWGRLSNLHPGLPLGTHDTKISGKRSTLTILPKNRGLRTVYTPEEILFVREYKLSLATVQGLRSLCFELFVRMNQGIVGCAWFIH